MAINSGEADPEAAARAMQDPEIQRIMKDPTMNKVLMDLQQDPASAQQYLRDPTIKQNLETLIAAGILKTK